MLKKLESRKTILEEERDSIAGMMKALVKAQVGLLFMALGDSI